MKRRQFLIRSSVVGTASTLMTSCNNNVQASDIIRPVVLSTWDFGKKANAVAWNILNQGGSSIEAVEKGVNLIEADPENQTVGIGGFPDRNGHVTLDACIMKGNGQCGSVAFLQNIKHPISVAKKVMESTPHIMLVGLGAQQFALESGFKSENLLTEKSQLAWKDWKKRSDYKPKINIENHDTISMLAIDKSGNISGACTTSGAAWKMHGRVGDSPIIGAGLFVDQDVGGACATGLGEEVIRTAGSAMVVEAMRNGNSPMEACKMIVDRIKTKQSAIKDLQVGFLAIDMNGNVGAYAVQPGFTYALRHENTDMVNEAESLF